jgi:hypothetical protein
LIVLNESSKEISMKTDRVNSLDESLFGIGAEQWQDRSGHRARLKASLASDYPASMSAGRRAALRSRYLVPALLALCVGGTAYGGVAIVASILRVTATGAGQSATIEVPRGMPASLTIAGDSGSKSSITVDQNGKATVTGALNDISIDEVDQ